jgi:hypothetical protein
MIVALAALSLGAACIGWREAHSRMQMLELRELQPIAGVMLEEQSVLAELRRVFGEQEKDILASYLARIRQEGMIATAPIKQRLDQLAENNAAMIVLLRLYAPHAVTPEFQDQADKFQRYAIAWRDRWNSVMEIYMAGGNLPATLLPFPPGFAGAVQMEMNALTRGS